MTQKGLGDFSFAFEDFVCVVVETTVTTFLIKFSSSHSKDVVAKVLQYRLLCVILIVIDLEEFSAGSWIHPLVSSVSC